MQKSAYLIFVIFLFILLTNCKKDNENFKTDELVINENTTSTGLQKVDTIQLKNNKHLLGKFSGEIPCAKGCESTEILFELFEDGTFTLNQLSYNVNVIPKNYKGNWHFNAMDNVYTLQAENLKNKYRLTKTGKLIQLDKNNKDLSTENADYYVFIKLKK